MLGEQLVNAIIVIKLISPVKIVHSITCELFIPLRAPRGNFSFHDVRPVRISLPTVSRRVYFVSGSQWKHTFPRQASRLPSTHSHGLSHFR